MPHYPVVQPDGKFAVYSTVVDAFSCFDMTAEEALDELLTWHRVKNYDAELDHLRRMAAGEPPKYPSWRGWDETAAWVIFFHRGDKHSEQRNEIENRTPIERMAGILVDVQTYLDDAED